MLIYLLLVYIMWPQNEVGARVKTFGVPKNELERLTDLKYYLCGLSPGYIYEKKYWRGIGWFCVDKGNCSGTEDIYKIADGTEPDLACDALRYNEGRDICCFTGKLIPTVRFDDPKDPDWDLYVYVKNTSKTRDLAEMEEHKIGLFQEHLQGDDSPLEVALRTHEICSVLPTGKRDGMPLWTPYVCVTEEQCEGQKHAMYVNVDIKFPFGDRFCSRSLRYNDRPVCCHVSTSIPMEKKKTDYWAFLEFLGTQKYAPGFRSKFMCELYNKLVCEGNTDHCAQKVLFRSHNTLPGEFPHHALVGISLPRRQTFHCQGSIISKLFVLTSYDCREHDNTLANIVLVGTFKFEWDEVPPIDEQISYVKNHISAHEKHWFLLLRLWRPLKLNAFVKPACIDWFTYDKDLSSKKFDFGVGWIVGYGPLTQDSNFTTNITRYNYNFESTTAQSPPKMEEQCIGRMSELKKKYFKGKFKDSHSHICILGESVYSPFLEEQQKINKSQLHGNHLGFFSQGASFSVFERYCQWKVYGVYIQNEQYSRIPPLLIETVPYALAWIEEIIWRDEFDWLFFNLSWPDCADWENYKTLPIRKGGKANEADHQFNFYTEDYIYVKPDYNDIFNGRL